MTALRIVAHLINGFDPGDPWSPSIDGILAAAHLRRTLGEEEYALGMTGHRPLVDAALPLARDEHTDWWWWQASAPIYDVVGRHTYHYHRRFDADLAATYGADGIRSVLVAGGKYKNFRSQTTHVLTPAVTWHAIGDASAVRDLLRDIDHIGMSRGGHGQVRRWDVAEDGDPAIARFHRPLPVAFALEHGVAGIELMRGIRPPVRAPQHQTLCVMPDD